MEPEVHESSEMLNHDVSANNVGNCSNGKPPECANVVQRSRTRRMLAILRTHMLLILVFLGVVTGFGLGFGLRGFELSDNFRIWLALPGDLFMRALKCIIMPLIVSSIITGTASLDAKTNGRVTSISIIYMVAINTIGVIVGVLTYLIINPAGSIDREDLTTGGDSEKKQLTTTDIFTDMIRNLFPDNIVSICFQKDQTMYTEVSVSTGNRTQLEFVRSVGKASSTNILGIIVACMLLGIATGKVGEAARPFVNFFKAATDVILVAMRWVIWMTPIGVLSLISTSVSKIDDVETMFRSFGLFIVTVICAMLIIHGLYPILVLAVLRMNPLKFLYKSLRPLMAGFAPPSSAMAIPEMLQMVESYRNTDVRISRFCVLFFASTCRTGSGAFVLITSMFLSHLEGVELSPGQVCTLLILSVVATGAIPSVPSASVVCIIIVLSSLGVQTSNIGIALALDWLHDRVRTTANVQGTIFGTLLVNKLMKDKVSEGTEIVLS